LIWHQLVAFGGGLKALHLPCEPTRSTLQRRGRRRKWRREETRREEGQSLGVGLKQGGSCFLGGEGPYLSHRHDDRVRGVVGVVGRLGEGDGEHHCGRADVVDEVELVGGDAGVPRNIGGRSRCHQDGDGALAARRHLHTATNKLRIVSLRVSGGRSLTGTLRDARRFPSTRW
jgi:hypothetical protein